MEYRCFASGVPDEATMAHNAHSTVFQCSVAVHERAPCEWHVRLPCKNKLVTTCLTYRAHCFCWWAIDPVCM